jgi:topoisomerase-4 subunit B
MSDTHYNAASIEVLMGLDPVRKRPGMYTDTARPNHLASEVIDNGVDEAIAGYADALDVILYEDGSLEVSDNGRGMPVDKHPKHKISGVELILSKLHAGAKFSNKNYQFSGGLHGVGVSVVNALSTTLDVSIMRGGKLYRMGFANGHKVEDLKVVAEVGKRRTGTKVHFMPNPDYFDSAQFSISRLKHTLRAKAVLCPGLRVSFDDRIHHDESEWYYKEGLQGYLQQALQDECCLPAVPFVDTLVGKTEQVDWAIQWLPEGGELVTESYVNLIPTSQGGTHVNGLRAGLLDAMRDFCEFRNLLPRGLKLTAEDLWESCAYVLSVKVQEPQFSGQTKERLSSRECASFVSGVVKDSFSLWLNHHTEDANRLAEMAIDRAQKRLRTAKKVARKKVTTGPALPGKLVDCSSQELQRTELFLVEGESAGGSAKQARDRDFQAVMALRGKILNTWEVDVSQVLASQEVHDIAVALGVDPGSDDLSGLRYGKVCILADADSDGAHIGALLCALFLKHFRPLVERGHVFVAMPPLFRIDVGKQVYYALDESEKRGVLDRIAAEKQKGKVNIQRFKGLGEMNPMQLRETTMAVDTRRLVQLVVDKTQDPTQVMDKLFVKKRAADRKRWLEDKGDLAGEAL